jgi:hypothetical protein
MYIDTFFLRMTDTMTSQNIDLSSWDIYIELSWYINGLGPERSEFPTGARDLSLLYVVQTASGAHPAFSRISTGVFQE